ncbi:MAG TPA: CHAD domain-containing protein, partial [Beijerinckiaceae bacterium]|nr:CHAD domain-containing protein [Beijerinckiaceae bacterium]
LAAVLSARRLHGRLKPVFWTEVERTTWRVRSKGAEVEVAVDEGRVVADGQSRTFAEVELELKDGSPSDLFTLARALSPAGGLKLGVLTKAERGYALAAKDAPSSFRAEAISLQPEMSTADAFRTIVQACIRHFRLNEPLLLATRTAEPLHQCRVALRRLRTALSVFRDVVSDDEFENLRDRLKSISQKLGEARDLDILLGSLQDPHDEQAESEPDKPGLIERARADRERAYDRLMTALDGQRYRTLMFELLAWSETGRWLQTDAAAAQARREQPIESFAAEVLERRRRKIRKRARHLDALNPPDRHRVRIEAKKLRYASEFFSSLAADKKTQRRQQAFTKTLEDLQEHLGELNDLATRDKIVTDAAHPDGQPDDAGAAAGRRDPGQRRAHKRAMAGATRAYQSFADAKRFWTAHGTDRTPGGRRKRTRRATRSSKS